MIRRNLASVRGEACWALISQIEHARLSGVLARRLTTLQGSADDRRQTLAAIDRHDNGWADYDARPMLDEQGRPRSFMEMPLDDSLAIWTASVDQAEAIGPLAGWLVAGHFARLLGHSDRLAEAASASRWQQTMARRRDQWQSEWGGEPATAEKALDWLQALDAVSLWICGQCAAAGDRSDSSSEPYPTSAAGQELRWKSLGPGKLAVETTSFAPGTMELEAAGNVVPVARYPSSEQLLDAERPRLFRWELQVVAHPGPN